MSDSRIHIEGLKPADVALLKMVAVEAASQAVTQTLTAMGMDPSKPFDAQKDMMWLRSTRERCEGTIGKALLTVIGLVIVGSVAAFWAGFKAFVTGGSPHP